jgi:hypothetical protein
MTKCKAPQYIVVRRNSGKVVFTTVCNKTELAIFFGKISWIRNFPRKIAETILGNMPNIRHDFSLGLTTLFGNGQGRIRF